MLRSRQNVRVLDLADATWAGDGCGEESYTKVYRRYQGGFREKYAYTFHRPVIKPFAHNLYTVTSVNVGMRFVRCTGIRKIQ